MWVKQTFFPCLSKALRDSLARILPRRVPKGPESPIGSVRTPESHGRAIKSIPSLAERSQFRLRNDVTHKPAIAGYDPKMAVLEKVFLIIELLLVFGLVTKITFGA